MYRKNTVYTKVQYYPRFHASTERGLGMYSPKIRERRTIVLKRIENICPYKTLYKSVHSSNPYI
jgi:hypothetical protein